MARQPEVEEPRDEPASPWGWIAAVLGVLVLLAGGVLLFLLLSGRSPSASPSPPSLVGVPEFVGQLLPAAEAQATELGLVLSIAGYQQTAEAPENSIIGQDPAFGQQVSRGSRVEVEVATQRVTVQVPDLRLRTETELLALLVENDLQAGARSEAFDPEVPATLVVRTDPRAGIEVARGTVIDYTLSLGPPPSPSPTQPPTPSPPFVEPTATPVAPTAPPPTIIIITPEPQTPIVITPGPPLPTPPPTAAPSPVPVGNYATCGSLGQAKEQIVAAGLQVGVVFPYEADDLWQVAQQAPLAGDQVPPGTFVHLLVIAPTDPCP